MLEAITFRSIGEMIARGEHVRLRKLGQIRHRVPQPGCVDIRDEYVETHLREEVD